MLLFYFYCCHHKGQICNCRTWCQQNSFEICGRPKSWGIDPVELYIFWCQLHKVMSVDVRSSLPTVRGRVGIFFIKTTLWAFALNPYRGHIFTTEYPCNCNFKTRHDTLSIWMLKTIITKMDFLWFFITDICSVGTATLLNCTNLFCITWNWLKKIIISQLNPNQNGCL